MKSILYLLFCVTLVSCAQKKQPILGETAWQKQMNADFKDASKSPLKDKDLKRFNGLEFFPVDSSFVVTAILTRTPNEAPFEMKTTTERLPLYVKYGVVSFKIKGEEFQLNIYQNLGLMKDPEYEDYLFLPFLDTTNGESSYSGGRYVETHIPNDDTLIIDFNQAYNPYCAYNSKYSCPIVPIENYLDIEILAGVKAFKKH